MRGAAPARRLTAGGQALACSYDIYGCVARAGVSAVTRAPTTPGKPPEPAAEPEMYLEESDLYSTKWSIVATPREDSWMQGGPQEQARALSWPPKNLRGPPANHRCARRELNPPAAAPRERT